MNHFLVHGKEDSVGVVVTDVKAGESVTGWNMESGEDIQIAALSDIPLGHKIALADVPAGGLIVKYGHPIGKVVQAIKRGEHVHVHNLKTRRW